MKRLTLGAHYDVMALHQKLNRDAIAREKLPTADLAELARVAADAYHEAKRQGANLDVAYERAQEALDASREETDSMLEIAEQTFERDEGSSRPVRRREFAYEFAFGAIAPALALVFVLFLAKSQGETEAKTAFIAIFICFLAATLWGWIGASKRSLLEPMSAWQGVLSRSGGALAAGLFVFATATVAAQQYGRRQFNQETSARLLKIDQAAAVALAAIKADASLSKAQAAVINSTSASWIDVRELSDRRQGAILVSAALPGTETAELRLSSRADEPARLESLLRSSSGETRRLAGFFVGKVIKADLDSVTISSEAKAETTFTLPKGMLPPPVGSTCVAAIREGETRLAFIQPIDSVVAGLKQ